jgi:hypothetical protein
VQAHAGMLHLHHAAALFFVSEFFFFTLMLSFQISARIL